MNARKASHLRPVSPSVLYIEDNRENRMLIRSVLSAAGWVVREAEDGLAGIEAAIREPADLILLDINLPHVDGYEVASILKSFPALAKTPVVAVTAYAMEGDRERTLVAGCDGYIQKPIDVDRLPEQLAEFLGGRRDRIEGREEGPYLRELNQRLVYRLLDHVEELKRLNGHFVRRAGQLEALHDAVADITSELGVRSLLERLLPSLSRALGTTSLGVEMSDPAGLVVSVEQPATAPAPRVPAADRSGQETRRVEWRVPLSARGRSLGTIVATHQQPAGPRADEEQLLKIVANHLAIAVENSRLYDGMRQWAAQQESLVEAGRLLASSLDVDEILGRLTELARIQLRGDVVRIWLQGDQPGSFRLHAHSGGRRSLGDSLWSPPSDGLAGWIMAEGRPLVIPDLNAEDFASSRQWWDAEGLVSFLGVPLILEGQSIGVLVVLTKAPRVFTTDEVRIVEALATSAAAAIRNARLYAQAQARLRQTETLLTVGQELGSTLDLPEVARRTVRELVRALRADAGVAWRLASPGNDLLPLAGYHLSPDLVKRFGRLPLQLDERLVEEVKNGPVYATDTGNDPRFDHPLLRPLGFRSVLLCPIRFKEETLGVFAVAWQETAHTLTADDLRLAEGIARLGAMAIENGRLYGELRHALQVVEDSQQRIVQGERLRALGEMAGGVAHDFNNVLAIIVGRVEALLDEAQDPELRRQLEVVVNVAFDATQTVKRIQEFTRMRRRRPFSATDLNRLVAEVRELVSSRWKDEAESRAVRYHLNIEAGDVPPVACDPAEIREALTNILFNALDAMPDGGRVTLRTGTEGDRVFCQISDTGAGMPENVRQRVFDPFFTTKGERGTGLGLSMVYGIVSRHGGEVDVQSEPGVGSVFTMRLPIAEAASPDAPASVPASADGKGRILVVDDEQEIREALRDMLTRDGHAVVACGDCATALAELERQPLDLIITDLGMPGSSGWDLARLAKLHVPRTPIAMITGWCDRIDVDQASLRGVDYLVSKPFRRVDIRRLVAAALAKPTDGAGPAVGSTPGGAVLALGS